MASSRFMRNSPRTASPLDVAMKDSSTPEDDIAVQQESRDVTVGWTEPPLRAPAPSFEDYKGLERHGVLEHMAPLGAMPNQKVKQRVKQSEPSRRSLMGKQAEAAGVSKEAMIVPEITMSRRRSESRKVEDRPTRVHAHREKDEDQDYNPKGPTSKSVVAKATSSRNSVAPAPSSKTIVGQERLRLVVESAVERSRELGNELLGLAVRRLFEDSLTNRTLAELLDAVLSQKPTSRQATDFQAYIKVARKQIKYESNLSRRSSIVGLASSSQSASKSPSKGVAHSLARPIATPLESTEVDNSKHLSQQNGKAIGTNGVHDHHPAKRLKRSKSISSTSSLSSLSSTDLAIDVDHSQNNNQSHSPTAAMVRRGARPTNGPKLGNFSTGRTSSRRSTGPVSQPSPAVLSDEELAAKRRKLQKSFDDVKVEESNLRTVVTATASDNGRSGNVTPLTLDLGHATRTNRAGRREDYDDVRSSASSTQGDFLVPPPPGAQRPSRGATPNQPVGGPKREVRKGARIKNSPMKKKTGVVAGIAQKGGGKDGSVGYGYGGDNGEVDNVDNCTACGGNGQLLCCDGCIRSFHFKCLDPPMNPRHPPEGEWFCHICVSKRDPQPNRPEGLFASLLSNLDKQNPIAFNLPPEIRDYFEHVQTGEDGEYVDTFLLRAKPREGHQEYLKTHDAKGNLILCYKCGKTSGGTRQIIACDFCPNRVHLDCLDPPLTYPPSMTINWQCPAHFDQELLHFICPGGDRLIKVRRPKHPRIIDSALRRGVKNNGNVEILNDSTDDEDETEMRRAVYRLPESSVKLDFIDRCRMDRTEVVARTERKGKCGAFGLAESQHMHKTDSSISSHTDSVTGGNPLKRKRDLDAAKTRQAMQALAADEQDAVFTLLNLGFSKANASPASPATATTVQIAKDLVITLIDQAPANVTDLSRKNEAQLGEDVIEVKAESSTALTSDGNSHREDTKTDEKQLLLMVQELIRRRLQGSGPSD